jgi:hypothetical protein
MVTSLSFDQVCTIGNKESQEATKSGLFLLVDISELRDKRVAPLALPRTGRPDDPGWNYE